MADPQVVDPYADPVEADVAAVDTSTGTLFKKAFQRFRHEMLPPGNPLHVFAGHSAQSEDSAATAQRAAEVAEYKQNLQDDKYGLTGHLVDAVPMALATAPLGAGMGNLFTKGASRFLGPISSRITGEVAANSALGAGEAAVEGKDVGQGALWGGIGGGLGYGVGAAGGAGMKYLSPKITPEAKSLLARGYQPSPGQLSPDGILAAMERTAGVNPLVNEKVVTAQGAAAAQNFNERVAVAADRIGVPVRGEGKAAVRNLKDDIDTVYKEARANTFAHPKDVNGAFASAAAQARSLAGGNLDTYKSLKGVLQEVKTQMGGATQIQFPGVNMALPKFSGDRLRDVDIYLGKAIKDARKANESLKVQVLEKLQDNLRDATTALDDPSRELLDKVNASRRDLFALEKAAKGNKATGGTPSGEKLDAALTGNKQQGEPALAAVDTGARSRPSAAMTLAGFLHSPLKSTAATVGGNVMYSPGGIRAATAYARAAGGARGIYGKSPFRGQPTGFTRALGRKAGQSVGEDDEDYSTYE